MGSTADMTSYYNNNNSTYTMTGDNYTSQNKTFDNNRNSYSGLMADQEVYIVMGILIFLSIIGTAGNAIVLYVFSKKRDKLVSTLFILVLAFVDFVTCLVVIPYTIVLEYIRFEVKYAIICKVYQFLITSNIPFSCLIMVAIAVDRYLCICHPFLQALNTKRAKYVTAVLGLFTTCIGVMVALMYGVTEAIERPFGNHNNYNVLNLTYNGTQAMTWKMMYNVTFAYSPGMDHTSGTEVRIVPEGFTVHATTSNMNIDNLQDNITSINDNKDHGDTNVVYVNSGVCQPDYRLLSKNFQWYYQKIYSGLFFLCLVIVIVLYILIYRSVLHRRAERQKQKSRALHLVQSETCHTSAQEETLITNANGEHQIADTSISHQSNGSLLGAKEKTKMLKDLKKQQKQSNRKRKSTKKDRMRTANLKTAAMLFVVTVVFILTFLPAFLMTNEMIPQNIIIFYMYFANNVANPVIYSFMNKNFRDDLRKLFCSTNVARM